MRAETDRQRRCRRRDGSILLETVIALPVFMLLIGGALWVGDLLLARQRLLAADRYAAWNLGNRYLNTGNSTPIYRDIQKQFFEPAHRGYERVMPIGPDQKPKRRWWHQTEGSCRMNIRMPEWVEGWFILSEIWGTRTGNIRDTKRFHLLMTGREVPNVIREAFYRGHVVISRTPVSQELNYFRNWSGQDLADPVNLRWVWLFVRMEPWYPVPYEMPEKAYEGGEYVRVTKYNMWSRWRH